MANKLYNQFFNNLFNTDRLLILCEFFYDLQNILCLSQCNLQNCTKLDLYDDRLGNKFDLYEEITSIYMRMGWEFDLCEDRLIKFSVSFTKYFKI